MFLLYSLFYSVAVVLVAPYYLWRMRGKSGSAGYWRERLGVLPLSFQRVEPGAIWVHAVSVGETLAVVGLVRALQEQYPTRQIFLSHVTPAGREAGEKRLPALGRRGDSSARPAVAGRFYLPLDWVWCVRRVLDRIRPTLLVIVETELWPNLLREARKSGSRIVLVNARLSARSLRGYRLIRPFMRRILEQVEWVCAQTSEDAERFQFLGARTERVVVTGNLKFDARPPRVDAATHLRKALEEAQRTPIVVAASTMAGEEALLLQSWEEIRRRRSKAMLLLAPRHPQRFEEVAQFLTREGKSFVRRTALEMEREKLARQLGSPEILLLDTIGELAGIFELADLVFIGGSLVPSGGHNLLEPAFWGKPILFGPHMANFRDVANLFLQAGAAVEVRDPQELARQALELLGDSARRLPLGEKAKQVLEQASGATERVLDHIKGMLEADGSIRAGV